MTEPFHSPARQDTPDGVVEFRPNLLVGAIIVDAPGVAPSEPVPAIRAASDVFGSDDDESAELAGVLGVGPDGAPVFDALPADARSAAAELDARAGEAMRMQARHAAKLAECDDAERRELARIQSRYVQRRARIVERVKWYERVTVGIAMLADAAGLFLGRSKSRKVGSGTYGTRAKSGRVKVADVAALTAWAMQYNPPGAPVFVTATMPLAVARERFTAAELAGTDSDVRDVQTFAQPTADPKTLREWWRTTQSVERATRIECGEPAAELAPETDVPGLLDVPGSTTYYADPLPWGAA